MAEPPILTLADIRLGFGGEGLFEGVTLAIHPGERIALVGRNGSGKSTLMKLMAGLVEADAGTRFVRPGVSVGYMAQDPDLAAFATLGAFAGQGLDAGEAWRVAELSLATRRWSDVAASRDVAMLPAVLSDGTLTFNDGPKADGYERVVFVSSALTLVQHEVPGEFPTLSTRGPKALRISLR